MGLRNWNTGTLVAEWRNPATGRLVPGFVTISTPVRLTNAADDAIIPAGRFVYQQALNVTENLATADGRSLSLTIPGTDDPDTEQSGWGWTVEAVLEGFGKETYSGVQVPVGGTANLRTLVPTVTAAIPTASLNLDVFPRWVGGELLDGQGNLINLGEGFTQSQVEEFARDAVGAALVAGTGVTITPNDGANTITITATGGGGGTSDHGELDGLSDDDHTQYYNAARLTEAVQDIVGSFIVAGTNVTVAYNDAANTFTINASGGGGGEGGETDPEIVRDVIGSALVASTGIQITVNDAGDTITIASTAVLPTRTITAGTGLSGGGDLSANRTLAVDYGTTADTACQGNDARLADARTPTAHTHDDRYFTESEVTTALASKMGTSGTVTGLWQGTQAEYDGLTPDPAILYFILDA